MEWERGIGFKRKRGEGRGWGRKGEGREREGRMVSLHDFVIGIV